MGNILNEPQAPVKMLLIGDSGTGKTGAIFALARAGFRVVFADFDNGLDIIREEARKDLKAAENVFYKSFFDEYQTSGTGLIGIKGVPTAFSGFLKAMDNWPDLGPVENWDNKTVLAVDSFTHLGHSAMRLVLALQGRQLLPPRIQDWGEAMGQVENLLGKLYSPRVKCNVIVCCHVGYYENEDTKEIKGLPLALGQKLAPKVPTYFNTMVVAKTKGTGDQSIRTLHTKPIWGVEAKLPVLSGVPAELPQKDGLVTIFKSLGATP